MFLMVVVLITTLQGAECIKEVCLDAPPPCAVHSGFSLAQYPLCTQDQLQLINASWNAYYFEWYFNGALFSNDEHPVLQLSGPGCHHILLISSDAFCSDTSELWIEVNQLYHVQYCVYLCPGEVYQFAGHELSMSGIYTAEYTSVAGCDSIIDLFLFMDSLNAGFVVQGQTATAVPGNVFYQWCDCSNGYTAIPGATGHQFSPPSTGSYALITGNTKCTDTSECQQIVVIGVDDNAPDEAFMLIPNPARDQVSCRNLPAGTSFEAVLIAPDGRVVTLSTVSSDHPHLNLRGVNAGVYLLRLTAPGKAPITHRLKIE